VVSSVKDDKDRVDHIAFGNERHIPLREQIVSRTKEEQDKMDNRKKKLDKSFVLTFITAYIPRIQPNLFHNKEVR